MRGAHRIIKKTLLIFSALITLFVGDDAYALVCGTDTVSYDGKNYSTVQLGNQCWFRESLNVGSMLASGSTMPSDPPPTLNVPSSVQKWCGNGVLANCTTDGGLYSWAEANALANACLTTNCSISYPNQGICPTGWHIPTHDEITTLERAICTSGTCSSDFPYDTTTANWTGTNEGTKLKTISSTTFSFILAGQRSMAGGLGGRPSWGAF